jgi:hypothetical protein
MTTGTTYDIGDRPTYTAVFRNVSDVATDPTVVRFKFQTPAGTSTTYTYGVDGEVVRTGTGTYTFQPPTFTTAGGHYVRAEGTGALVAATEQGFDVRRSAF